MAEPSWDARAQFKALTARKRHEESVLALSGSLLGLTSAVFLTELLAVNDDTNTFLVVGALNLAMLLAWLGVARRTGLQARRWMMKAKVLEKDALRVPSLYSFWEESGRDALPAWMAVAAFLIALVVSWAGFVGYAFWVTYL